MSGGSYDYLFSKMIEGAVGPSDGHLRSLIDRMRQIGMHKEADDLRLAADDMLAVLHRFQTLARAIEWWDSSDSSFDTVVEVAEELGMTKPTNPRENAPCAAPLRDAAGVIVDRCVLRTLGSNPHEGPCKGSKEPA